MSFGKEAEVLVDKSGIGGESAAESYREEKFQAIVERCASLNDSVDKADDEATCKIGGQSGLGK